MPENNNSYPESLERLREIILRVENGDESWPDEAGSNYPDINFFSYLIENISLTLDQIILSIAFITREQRDDFLKDLENTYSGSWVSGNVLEVGLFGRSVRFSLVRKHEFFVMCSFTEPSLAFLRDIEEFLLSNTYSFVLKSVELTADFRSRDNEVLKFLVCNLLWSGHCNYVWECGDGTIAGTTKYFHNKRKQGKGVTIYIKEDAEGRGKFLRVEKIVSRRILSTRRIRNIPDLLSADVSEFLGDIRFYSFRFQAMERHIRKKTDWPPLLVQFFLERFRGIADSRGIQAAILEYRHFATCSRNGEWCTGRCKGWKYRGMCKDAKKSKNEHPNLVRFLEPNPLAEIFRNAYQGRIIKDLLPEE